VVENPTIQVRGKNLLQYPFAYSYGKNPISISGITYTDNGDGSILVEGTSTATSYYNLDFTTDVKQLIGKVIRIPKISAEDNVFFTVGFFFEDGSYLNILSRLHPEAKVPEHVTKLRVYIGVMAGKTISTTIWPCIYIAGEDDKFTKYTSQAQAFTLPSEHPYLAKLPDGTADEITVDRDGNVELVARVAKAKVPDNVKWTLQSQGSYSLAYSGTMLTVNGLKKNAGDAIVCEKYQASATFKNAPCIGITEVLWFVPRTNSNDITVEECAKAAKGMTFYTSLAEEARYKLGRIDMPKAQDSIVNVWTDAEVTPNTSISYVRDVNIVIANIESAIASIS
jgi:hypothetical protein